MELVVFAMVTSNDTQGANSQPDSATVSDYNNTVAPRLSKSPLSDPLLLSERYYECRNPKRQFNFLHNQVINGMLV